MLGDMVASCSGGFEGGGKRADVEANPALGLRNEDLGGDDGAPHAHVGEAATPGDKCSLLLTAFCCILVHFDALSKISLHSILLHS